MQLCGFAEYDYPWDPSSSSTCENDYFYYYRRQDRTDKYPGNVCTTSVAANDYFHDVREQLLPLPPPRERLLPRRPVNAYFLYTAPNSFRPETLASKV